MPRWAMQQVGGFLRYSGRGATGGAKAAHDPEPTSRTRWGRSRPACQVVLSRQQPMITELLHRAREVAGQLARDVALSHHAAAFDQDDRARTARAYARSLMAYHG